MGKKKTLSQNELIGILSRAKKAAKVGDVIFNKEAAEDLRIATEKAAAETRARDAEREWYAGQRQTASQVGAEEAERERYREFQRTGVMPSIPGGMDALLKQLTGLRGAGVPQVFRAIRKGQW